jgi:hypothetical protein
MPTIGPRLFPLSFFSLPRGVRDAIGPHFLKSPASVRTRAPTVEANAEKLRIFNRLRLFRASFQHLPRKHSSILCNLLFQKG